MNSFSVYAIDKNDTRKLQALWQQLHNEEKHSFFISWNWVHCWIKTLPADIKLELLTCHSETKPVFAAIIGKAKTDLPARLLSLHTAFLNETGLYQFDDLVIELNGLIGNLTDFDHTLKLNELLRALNCNRLCIKHVTDECLNQLMKAACKRNISWHERANISHFVCLNRVRNNKDYLSLLSSNKRTQIRRSTTLLQASGNFQLEQASDTEQAQRFFDEMVKLHQLEWTKRGKEGAFSNPFIYDFHQNLINDHLNSGKVRIYKFSTSSETIGIIYGFISNQDFLYYQSGFNYVDDNKIKPGLSCHALLIEHLAEQGLTRYDFLAGNAPYKKSLGTDSYKMHSIDILDNSLKSIIYLKLKQFKTTLQKIKRALR